MNGQYAMAKLKLLYNMCPKKTQTDEDFVTVPMKKISIIGIGITR
ncbi:hypothetical protein JCM10914A_19750 [Paenibacillus sp. JCM 10914]